MICWILNNFPNVFGQLQVVALGATVRQMAKVDGRTYQTTITCSTESYILVITTTLVLCSLYRPLWVVVVRTCARRPISCATMLSAYAPPISSSDQTESLAYVSITNFHLKRDKNDFKNYAEMNNYPFIAKSPIRVPNV